MRVPLGWLAEWIDLPDEAQLSERLTLAGVEIEGVERTGPDLSEVRVGHVVACERHPSADRLSLCRVDLGDGEPVDIVCGAPNVAAGQRVAVASPGTTLPDGTKLKKTKIRGVTSHGMICSTRELGLGDEHEGIRVLDPDAPLGASVSQVLPAGQTVLDVEITPNRGDWSSLIGMAREVRAQFGGELRLPACDPPERAPRAEEDVAIEIDDAEGCAQYVGRVVRGVRVGPSPDWLVKKLEAAGVRAINCVVDVTNLVLLEFGQPLHAFDLATLRGREVRVRRATPGEKLRTLDDQMRELGLDDLVIADAERAIAVAGLMGGAETEVRESTRDVLIESAQFDPVRVRQTARRLGLHSEASYRFERGVDAQGVRRAADRAARLLAELAGGQVAEGRVEARGRAFPHCDQVRLDPELPNRLLGTALSGDQVIALLGRLELRAERAEDGLLDVAIPSFRNDLAIAEDLVEEVARIHGYDRITPSLPAAAVRPVVQPPELRLHGRARDSLRAAGLTEVRGFPGMREDDVDALRLAPDDARRRGVRVLNPVLDAEPLLQTTLVPALLRAARANLDRQVASVRLFELAHTFLAQDGDALPREVAQLVAVWTAGERGSLWEPRDEVPLFFQAKGAAEALLADLRRPARFAAGSDEPYLHPGVSGHFTVGRDAAAHVGELHPEVAAHFGIDVPCALLCVDLDAVGARAERPPRFEAVPPYPAVRRDLAVVLDQAQSVGDVLDAIRKSAGKHLISLDVFDRYRGEGVPRGKVSLAFRLVLQRPDRTLKDAEITKTMERVVGTLARQFGAEQR